MNLFDREALGAQAWLLRGRALPQAAALLTAVREIESRSPFRHMLTPGGFTMSVALTNCGTYGWTTDRRGYRYTERDPETGLPWPPMPELLRELAAGAAREAGFDGFTPDACLINRYRAGSRMSLHQDRNEADFSQPIVSVSLGMTATFQFGGVVRAAPCAKLSLEHGDVVVWGGSDRLRFHGVLPLRGAPHPLLGEQRLNLTFRRAA